MVRLEPTSHRVVVGPKTALARDRLSLTGVNWLGGDGAAEEGLGVSVKLRSAMAPVAAPRGIGPGGEAAVVFAEPQ